MISNLNTENRMLANVQYSQAAYLDRSLQINAVIRENIRTSRCHSCLNKGFTLIELMLTITIASILFGVALPSFSNITKNSRLTSNANLIVGAYNLARTEAITRGKSMMVKKSGQSWQVIQVDPELLVKVFEPSSAGITFTPSNFPDVTYTSTGFRPFSNHDSVKIVLCDNRNKGRTVTVTPSGMTKLSQECDA